MKLSYRSDYWSAAPLGVYMTKSNSDVITGPH